ncbi:hypothetical protein ACLKA7_000485 [Drosophila subpalustris]
MRLREETGNMDMSNNRIDSQLLMDINMDHSVGVACAKLQVGNSDLEDILRLKQLWHKCINFISCHKCATLHLPQQQQQQQQQHLQQQQQQLQSKLQHNLPQLVERF